jgi:hypothetical protein
MIALRRKEFPYVGVNKEYGLDTLPEYQWIIERQGYEYIIFIYVLTNQNFRTLIPRLLGR